MSIISTNVNNSPKNIQAIETAPNKYTALSNTKNYLNNIASSEFNLESIASKITILAFPLFALFALFTLLADAIAELGNRSDLTAQKKEVSNFFEPASNYFEAMEIEKIEEKEVEYDASLSTISNMFEAAEIEGKEIAFNQSIYSIFNNFGKRSA